MPMQAVQAARRRRGPDRGRDPDVAGQAVGDTVEGQPDRSSRSRRRRPRSSCPSPFAGVVTELLVAEGTTVDVGTPIITVDDRPGRRSAGRRRRRPRPRDDMAAGRSPDAVGRSATPGRGPGGRARPDRRPGARRADRRCSSATARGRPCRPAAAQAVAPTAGPSAATAQQAVQTRCDHADPGAGRRPTTRARAAPAPTVAGGGDGAAGARCWPSRRCASCAKDLGVDLADADAGRRRAASITRDDVERGGRRRPPAPVGRRRRRYGARRRRGARDSGSRSRACARRPPQAMVRQRVHRAARHRVRDRRRHPHDGAASSGCAAAASSRGVKVSPLLLVAKALLLAVAAQPDDQRGLGRGRRRRSWSSTT